MKYRCRLNKLPYLLWFNENKIMDIDLKEKLAVDENGLKSNMKKSKIYFIFLIKYIPVLFIFLVGIKIPTDTEEGIFFGIGGALAYLFQILLVSYPSVVKKVFIVLVVFMYFMLYLGFAYEIEITTLFFIEFIIVFFFYREFSQKRYENYYYLENYEKKGNITLMKKKERPLIPLWGSKGFLKKNTGFNVERDFSINGYFIRVEEKIDEE